MAISVIAKPHDARRLMRVLHVVQRYAPFVGGSELYIQELSEHLVRQGHAVEVWTTDAWDLDYFWSRRARRVDRAHDVINGVTVRRFAIGHPPGPPVLYHARRRAMIHLSALPVDTTGLLSRLARACPAVPALHRAMQALPEGAFDLVHSTNIPFESTIVAADALATRAGIPHVVTPFMHFGGPGDHRIRRNYTMRHQIDLLRNAAVVVAQTDLEKTFLQAQGVPATSIEVVGVGTHTTARGDAERFRARYGIHGPIVYHLGAAAADKGTWTTIEAMRELRARGIDATFVMAGSTMLKRFEAQYESLSADERARCRWLGFISDEDKQDLAAAARVFCMPSRTESFGIVYLEAWLHEVPVIGARAGGVPAVIDDGVDGYLIEFGDVQALADRLEALLKDEGLARRLGRAGRAKVLASHTWDRKLEPMAALYERLLSPAGRADAAGVAHV